MNIYGVAMFHCTRITPVTTGEESTIAYIRGKVVGIYPTKKIAEKQIAKLNSGIIRPDKDQQGCWTEHGLVYGTIMEWIEAIFGSKIVKGS